jgi:hypothetical protein
MVPMLEEPVYPWRRLEYSLLPYCCQWQI